MPGFTLIRPKNKSTEEDKNTVETGQPENKKEEITSVNQGKNDQSTPNIEPTNKAAKENEPTAEIERKQREPETSKPTLESESCTADEMTTIRSRPKVKINCENCEKTFATPMFMYDYSEGKRDLVACCPYCSQIIGKPPNEKLKETENVTTPEIEKITRLQEKAKKRDSMAFQINSDDLDELIKNTAYVR